jgi:hypothetical protein
MDMEKRPMKRMRIVAVSFLLAAGLAIAPPPAHAFLPVIDPTAIGRLVAQLRVAIQTYQEAIQIFNSVNGLAHAETWAPALNNPAMQNPLPFAANQFPSYVSGQTSPSGLPFGQQYLTQNTVGGNLGAFQDNTFVGNQIAQRIQAISAMQATATNNLASLEQRLAALPAIAAQLASAATIQQTSSIATRLASEENYVQSQQTQASNMLAAGQMQLAALKMQMRQYEYLDEQNGINTMCGAYAANSAGMPSLPDCRQTGATPSTATAAVQ